jgi:nitrite reductase/ring-hydroxylating ferredoxin subunit
MTNVAIGLSQNLPNGRVMRAIVHEQDLVVWRSKSGVLSAWDNRCPHRGMRLSHGFVRGEALACVYHGWHYDKKATCRYIPAHPELEPPETIKAQQFNSMEKGGLIWVNIDDNSIEPSIDENLTPLRSISLSCPKKNVQTVIRSTDFTMFDGEQINCRITEQNNEHWVTNFKTPKASLHLFFQELPNHSCTIHTMLDGEHSAQTKKHMSHVLENLRRMAEKQYEVAAS